MRKLLPKLLISVIPLLVVARPASAAVTPLAVSLFSPVQFPSEEVTVTGARIDLLWGYHRNVYGFDLGVGANVTSQNFGGILQAAGIFNYNQGETTVIGVQLAGITNVNVNKATIFGAQVSLYNSNVADSLIVGLDLGLIANVAPHATVVGVQLGLYNSAREVYGVQIGLFNSTDILHGLQIGLLNTNRQGLFSVCPILNFGF